MRDMQTNSAVWYYYTYTIIAKLRRLYDIKNNKKLFMWGYKASEIYALLMRI